MTRFLIGVTVLALTLLGTAYTQEKDKAKKADDPAPKLKGMLPANFKKLGLTDKQVQEVYKVRADYKGKIDDLNRRIGKLKDEEKDALDKVLTAEQRKRLKELRTGEKSSK